MSGDRGHAQGVGRASGGADRGRRGSAAWRPDCSAGGGLGRPASRDGEALNEVAREVELAGGPFLAVPTDVADWPQVEDLARAAVDHFGRIDTWVNDAGVALGGTVEQTEIPEIERIFASTCWARSTGSRPHSPT